MPKISLHVEADSAEEYLAILAAIRPPLALGAQHSFAKAQAEAGGVREAVEATKEVLTTLIQEVESVPVQEYAPEVSEQAPVAEKPARKPRGPNKPKMTPVTEEAPEEVEHVGTVAVGTRKVEEEKPAVTERVPEEGNGEVLTRMDLGDTIAGYVRKYGINFAQTDVSKMLQDMFGADVRKKSDVPEDQPSLRKAITTITQATIDNPYNRKVDVNG